jgi:hypothetical protein
MSQFATPRNNEIGITDQRIPHNPEGGETTELRGFGLLVRSEPLYAPSRRSPMSYG